MIAQLTGTIVAYEEKGIVIDVHGIGYLVYMNHFDFPDLGSAPTILTCMIVREDAQELYGFKDSKSRELFKMLINISGIGPRGALGILGLARTDELLKYIGRGDAAYLTKVSGIGKKTAEKIVLELRDKVTNMTDADSSSNVSSDAIEALTALGYSLPEIRLAISTLPDDTDQNNTQEIVKLCMKYLRQK